MIFLRIICLFILFCSENAFAQSNKKASSTSENINFTSDNLQVNESTNIMTASGNVIITSDNRKITADKVEYNQTTDKAIAIGNVLLTEQDGSIYVSDKVVLTNEFKSIVAIPLYAKLVDRSYITAKELLKNDAGESFFNEGVYSACECNVKEGETPIWRIESKIIKHDPLTQTVYLSHPVLKIFSMPIYYLPYLSFPDWTVKRRSGFLTPTYGYSEQNRLHIKVPYYYAPENDPTWDMTFTSHQNGKTGHADQLNIRKQYETTSLETNIFKGNLNTNKSDGDNVFSINLFANSKLKSDWNMTLEGKYADQETFMRRYGFDGDTTYKSFINLENLRLNSMSNIEIYNIQNLNEIKTNNEPTMAPSISHHIFNNNEKYNYDIKLNAHSIYNDESYDIKRWSGLGEINKKYNLNNWILEGDLNLGLDLYSIQGRPSTDKNNNRYIDRISSGFSVAASKHYKLESDNIGMMFEPKIQFSSVFSSDRTDEVPNRDSSEFRLDQANLFLNNQYQGRDNIQGNDRVNAGFTSLIMTENYGDLNLFIGQSQKLSGTQKNINNVNQNRQSHIINSMDWNPSTYFNFSWFALYNHHDLKSDVSDLNLSGSINNWDYAATHRSVDGEFVSNNTDREELSLDISKNFATWKTAYGRTYDLNNNKEELISETLGLEYSGTGYMFGNCLTILFEYKSSGGTADRDLIPEDSIYLTFSFRNLGDLQYLPIIR
ncbi:LPS assembly protein LptD [Alphaproteobacteria bacterium]|nr:LPS assembly protein LptD [Alphaproteobacteria bacterium]